MKLGFGESANRMPRIKPASLPKLKTHIAVRVGVDQEAGLPAGARILPLQRHPDERGYFMEVVRLPLLKKLAFQLRQVSVSETCPGVVKAFHYHRRQSDLFCPLGGEFRIVLLDARARSATHGHGWSIYTGKDKPFLLHIPPLVAHGYEVLGRSPATMLYLTNREYDPSDELRAAWNDPAIGFPWSRTL